MYSKGEVVWAKIKGFPWWPGVVGKVQEDKEESGKLTEILVNFIGENSHARLGLDKVAKFEENFAEYAKMKKKKLAESIEIAQKIINNETTYEIESQKLDKMNRHKSSTVQNNLTSDLKATKPKPPPGKHSAEKDIESSSESESEPSHISNRSPVPAKPPQSEKKIKAKIIEKTQTKAKQAVINSNKSPISTTADRSPVIIKPAVHKLPSQAMIIQTTSVPKEVDPKDPGKNRARKLLKLDAEIEDSRSLKVPQNGGSIKTPADVIFNEERRPEKVVPKQHKTQPLFEGVQEELIEMISSKNVKNFNQISTKIESILHKLNYAECPISELLDKEIGKNIYIFQVLVDRFADVCSELEEEESESVEKLRDTLIETNHIIKDRIQRHYIENTEYLGIWLKKLDEKIEVKEGDQESKITKESESAASHKETINREMSKGLDLESDSSPKMHNEKLDEELHSEEEKNNTDASPQMEDKKKDDLKNQSTSSTNLVKEVSNAESAQSKKAEVKPVDPASITAIRKKIYAKLSKSIQDKYNMQKEEAQKITVEIEKKIYSKDPNIQEDYRANIMAVLKSIKYSIFDARELARTEMDYAELRNKVDDYQKENNVPHDNLMGEDTLTLNKESKSDLESVNSNSKE